jgi:hypothetical protein
MQTIYVRDDETAFEGLCDVCLTTKPSLYSPRCNPTVSGTLGRAADLGFRTCAKGHRILVKRVRVMAAA